MDVLFQNNNSWLDPVSNENLYDASNQITLLGKEGLATTLPISLLLAVSPFLQSVMTSSNFCSWSTSSIISLPTVPDSTVKLMAQILCKGEIDSYATFNVIIDNMKDLHDLLTLLGIDVKISPKLKNIKTSASATATARKLIVKDEMMDDYDEADNNKRADTPVHVTSGPKKKLDPLLGVKNSKRSMTISGGKADGAVQSVPIAIPNKCNICGAKYNTLRGLKMHIQLKHKNQETTQSNKNCPKCQLTFCSTGNLRRHYSLKHLISENESMIFPIARQDMVMVGISAENEREVHKKFKSKDENETQEQVKQDDDLSADCPKCYRKFSNVSYMLVHFRKKHRGESTGFEQEYGCQECDLKYSHPKGLKLHRSTVHEIKSQQLSIQDKNKFQCEECEKIFQDKSCLRRHMRYMHDEVTTFACVVCYHVTASKEDMREHCKNTNHDFNLVNKIDFR